RAFSQRLIYSLDCFSCSTASLYHSSSYQLFLSCLVSFFLILRPPPLSTLFPYTTLFRSMGEEALPGFDFDVLVDRTNTDCEKWRSEEHTSELQSRFDLVCRLLLEKKKIKVIASNAQENESGKRTMRSDAHKRSENIHNVT